MAADEDTISVESVDDTSADPRVREQLQQLLRRAQEPSGLGGQFAHPRGSLGRLAGALLAATGTARSRWVLSLLDLRPDDRVLEVGFGPGKDIERVAAVAVEGFVAGIDPSPVMVRQASRRSAGAIRAGRVELRQASMDKPLPYADAAFTKVVAINSFPFWRRRAAGLRELRRVLAPGGTIAIAFQPVVRGATPELVRATGAWLVQQLAAAGFRNVRLEIGDTKPMGTACVVAER